MEENSRKPRSTAIDKNYTLKGTSCFLTLVPFCGLSFLGSFLKTCGYKTIDN